MKSDLIVQSQNGITSSDQKTQQICVRVTPHNNNYIQNLSGLMDQVFCIKTTLKSVRMKFVFYRMNSTT